MHFFNPVHKMKLLEIVRALETDDETLTAAAAVGRRMGKEVVVIKESPGFITSRINAMIGNEAFYMLQEGIASAADIDKALKLGLNHPMGPFELVDLVGLDTRLHILEYLHKSLGEKFRPAPLLDLAILRIVMVGLQLWLLMLHDNLMGFLQFLHERASLPDDLYTPLLILKLLLSPFGWGYRPSLEVLIVLYWATVVAGVLALILLNLSIHVFSEIAFSAFPGNIERFN